MLYVICNPTAGNGRARKTGEMIRQRLDRKSLEYEFHWTEKAGHATALAKSAQKCGAETVLAVGGDGTAFEVARGLLGGPCALGVIPAGTGNDFIKTIGVPRSPEEALEYVLSHPAKKTDAGEINGSLFLNEIGTGFDVSVLDYAAKAKRYVRGILPYFYGVLRTAVRFHSIPVTYSADGAAPVTVDAFVVGVANGGVIGGGIVIAPGAKADDGLLDVVIVEKIPGRKLLSRLIGLMKGKILTFPETRHIQAASIEFSSPGQRLNVDGEIIPAPSASVRILPGALMIHR